MTASVTLPEPSANPPPPAGWSYLAQSAVTPAMTTWSIALLHDTADWPGPPPYWWIPNVVDGHVIAAQVQVHPPDAQNGAIHRGVSLFGPPAPATPASGIDVSDYQGSPDFAAVKASGRSFVFCKATEGTSLTMARFAGDWKNAKAAGLLRGAYLYFHPSEDGTAQASRFLAALGDDLGELPPVIDFETLDSLSTTAAQIMTNLAACAKALVSATNRRPIIYTSPGFWNAISGLGAVAAGCDLWVAYWGVSTPSLPTGWKNWTFWQFSSTATVPGVAGPDDASYFNGTLAELETWAGAAPTPPKPPAYAPGAVRSLQVGLNACGASPALAEDDIMGPLTKAACAKIGAS